MDEQSALATRLKTLRTTHGLAMTDVARCCGTARTNVYMWEVGGHEPKAATLARLEWLYGLPAGSLAKLSTEPRKRPDYFLQLAYASKMIRSFRKVRGWSTADLADRLGYSEATIHQYEAGRIMPPIETWSMIYAVFEIEERDFWEQYCEPKAAA